MNARAIKRKLREVGFNYVKDGSNHDVYSDGSITLHLSKGSKLAPRAIADLKRIIGQKQRLGYATNNRRCQVIECD